MRRRRTPIGPSCKAPFIEFQENMEPVVSHSPTDFAIYDCSLVRQATGLSCSNLRELLSAIQRADTAVLEHHMLRCALEDHFELYEFPNDLARWCWEGLGDRELGERLGLIDPYQHGSIESLRLQLINVIEDHLWSVDHPIWCRAGLELHLVGSQLVAYDTGQRLSSLTALAEALPGMSLRSLYYHVHEGRRRTGGQTDDFSAWLETVGEAPELATELRQLDFYFLNLRQLQVSLLELFSRHLPARQMTAGRSHGPVETV